MQNNETRTTQIVGDALSHQDAHVVLGRILRTMNADGMFSQRLSEDDVFEMYLLIVNMADRDNHCQTKPEDAMATFYAMKVEKELEKQAEAFVSKAMAFLQEQKVSDDIIYIFTLPQTNENTTICCEVSGRVAALPIQRGGWGDAVMPDRERPKAFHPHRLVDRFVEEVKEAKEHAPEVFEFLDLRMAGMQPQEAEALRNVLYASAELLACNGRAEEPSMEDIADVLLDATNMTMQMISSYITQHNARYMQGDANALNRMPAVLMLQQHCISLAWATRTDTPIALPRFSILLLNVADYLTYTDVMKEEEGWE